jgi:hypothetical protein
VKLEWKNCVETGNTAPVRRRYYPSIFKLTFAAGSYMFKLEWKNCVNDGVTNVLIFLPLEK